MNFNNHSDLEGCHAYLSASNYHWVNYSEEKLATVYLNHIATLRGTELHDLAAKLISLGQKLPRSKQTINLYVNDAIGFHMKPEQVLYYSLNCFGTADAIDYNEQKKFLRIHDLKTGKTPAHMEQLFVYDALFCLEYGIKPGDIDIENRIYQFDDYVVSNPTAEIIAPIMDKIITFDKIMNNIRAEEFGYVL